MNPLTRQPLVMVRTRQGEQGWLDLPDFLRGADIVQRWQLLYVLLFHPQLGQPHMELCCPDIMKLRDWMEAWLRTPAHDAVRQYLHPPLASEGLSPLRVPTQRELLQLPF